MPPRLNNPLRNHPRLRIRVHSCSFAAHLLAATLLLAGCSEFFAEPTQRATRAVASPGEIGTGTGEAMSAPTGSVPLVVVDLPNKKNEPATLHTILDDMPRPPAGPVTPATQPATRPAAQPALEPLPSPSASPVSAIPLKLVDQRNPADSCSIAVDNAGNALLTVTCPTGIGGLVLERLNDTWPAEIHLQLQYDALKPFTRIESFSAAELLSEDRRIPLKSRTTPAEGRATVLIPGFTRATRIAIDWRDAYR